MVNDEVEVIKRVPAKDYLFQLLACKRAGEMANELIEAPINFAPTYRLIVRSEKYDME